MTHLNQPEHPISMSWSCVCIRKGVDVAYTKISFVFIISFEIVPMENYCIGKGK